MPIPTITTLIQGTVFQTTQTQARYAHVARAVLLISQPEPANAPTVIMKDVYPVCEPIISKIFTDQIDYLIPSSAGNYTTIIVILLMPNQYHLAPNSKVLKDVKICHKI